MTVRPFRPWPDPVLQRAAEPVSKIDDKIQDIWNDMIDTMDAMPGLGLAAPQIGISLQLAVVDASDERGWAIRMANPRVLEMSKVMTDYPEGSPNLPGVHAEIRRPNEIKVQYLDHDGKEVTRTLEDLWARSTLHQVDHLAGKMYFDNLSKLKRKMLLKKAGKRAP